MEAVLITGDTYVNRRQLRAAGAIFDRDEMGYIARADNAKAIEIATAAGLSVVPYDATEEQITPATGERLRQLRQDRIDRKRAALRERADLADARATKALNRITPQERSFLSLSEPVKVGHHSERRHRRLLDKVYRAIGEFAKESKYAEDLRRWADWMCNARVKGDAERRRQARRDAADAIISVGDLVKDVLFGRCIVLAVNTRTYRVQVERDGHITLIDKSCAELLEKREPAPPSSRSAPKFAKGDAVDVMCMGRWCRGVVLRRTVKGYSVAIRHEGIMGGSCTTKRTFAESDLRAVLPAD